MNKPSALLSALIVSGFLVGCSSSGGGSGSTASATIPATGSSGGSSSSATSSESDSSANAGESGSGGTSPGDTVVAPGNGGGGSESGSGTVVEVLPSPDANFNTSFTDLDLDGSGVGDGVVLSGVDREFSFTITGDGDDATIALSDDSEARSGGTLSLSPRGDTDMVNLLVTTAKGTVVDYSAEPSDGFTTRSIENVGFDVPSPEAFILDFTPDRAATMVSNDPIAVGWDYQTFGVWVNETSSNSGSVGVISGGRFTPASNIPVTGTGEFTGYSAGLYTDGSKAFLTAAEVTASVSFQNRTVNFRTLNTHMAPEGDTVTALIDGGKPYQFNPAPQLNLSGSLSYAQGSNQFSGAVTTDQMSGDAVGHFFGPSATEIGGSFAVSGNEGQRYIGGFGAQRPQP